MNSHYTSVSITLILLCCILLAFMRYADQSFFNQASQANLAEIAAGKLAETKGNPKVRSLGKQMVADHTTAQNELVALAKKESITIPMSPDAEHKSGGGVIKNKTEQKKSKKELRKEKRAEKKEAKEKKKKEEEKKEKNQS